MTEDLKKSFEWLDRFLKLRPVLIMIITGLAFLTKPYWHPFLIEYPESIRALGAQMEAVNESLQSINQRLDQLTPQVFEYSGGSFVEPHNANEKPKFHAGETVFFHYTIRKNSDCSVVVFEEFYDVNKGVVAYSRETPPVHIPESREFRDVAIPVKLPDQPGTFRYSPRIIPQNCRGFSQRKPPSSNIFEVVKAPA